MLVINCKNYMEVAGDRIVRFVETAEKVSKRYNVEIAVAPPQHLIGAVAGRGGSSGSSGSGSSGSGSSRQRQQRQ